MLDNFVTVRAETTDLAIEKGLRELGVERTEADIHIITEGKKGLFGFGKQDAVVEVRRKVDISLSELTEELEKEMEQTEPAEIAEVITSDKEVKPLTEDSAETDSVNPDDEPGEILATEFLESEDIEESTEEPVKATDLDTHLKQPIDTLLEQTDLQIKSSEEVTTTADNLSLSEQLDLATQKVVTYLEEVIDAYGAHAQVDVMREGRELNFNIDTDKSGLIIGKHGKIINALQILAQTLFQQNYSKRMEIILNVGDYRDRRNGVLEQMAERASEEVLRTKGSVKLDSLPAYERKQVHAYLAKIPNVRTHSVGKDPRRFLVVEYVED